jgi:glycogen debranching enzyme
MADSSTGSNRGYDELVPHHIDVVHETRFYPKWGYQTQQTNEKTAMISIKKSLNILHVDLAQQGFTRVRTFSYLYFLFFRLWITNNHT